MIWKHKLEVTPRRAMISQQTVYKSICEESAKVKTLGFKFYDIIYELS